VQILDRQPARPISIIWIAAGARRVALRPPSSCNSGKYIGVSRSGVTRAPRDACASQAVRDEVINTPTFAKNAAQTLASRPSQTLELPSEIPIAGVNILGDRLNAKVYFRRWQMRILYGFSGCFILKLRPLIK